jgi:phosphohistidine swiveling domain-containing protein
MWCRLSDARDAATHGGKASALSRLAGAGLPVLPGICLSTALYQQALPAELPLLDHDLVRAERQLQSVRQALALYRPAGSLGQDLLQAILAELSGWPQRWIVRSSATCEDSAAGAMAGIFHSVDQVTGAQQLWSAITTVWAALWELPALALLRARSSSPAAEKMAVLIQPQLAPRVGGLALSRDVTSSQRIRIECTEGKLADLALGRVNPTVIWLQRGPHAAVSATDASPLLGTARLEELRHLLTGVEAALGLTDVEIEWADDGQSLWLLQGRAAAALPEHAPAFPIIHAQPAHRRGMWVWDREHNPQPLSPAHQQLVGRLYRAEDRFWLQNGYLYCRARADEDCSESTQREGPLAPASEDHARAEARTVLAALAQDVADERRRLATLAPGTRLRQALDCFVRFEYRYNELQGRTLAQAERALRALIPREQWDLIPTLIVSTDHGAFERMRAARALIQQSGAATGSGAEQVRSFVEHYGALPLHWDLASPTLGELLTLHASASDLPPADAPADLLASHDLAPKHEHERESLIRDLAAQLPAAAGDRFRALLTRARTARALGEDDDLPFAEALFLVRAAYLAAGELLARAGLLDRIDQVFLLPLDPLLAVLEAGATKLTKATRSGDVAPECNRLRRLAALAQRAEQRAHQLQLDDSVPHAICDGIALWPRPRDADPILAGIGIGGIVRGEAVLLAEGVSPLALACQGKILVCSTLEPSLALVMPALAGLITDHGGLLSHAACLARELGLPAVIGTNRATKTIASGQEVIIDGRLGYVLHPASSR